MIKKIDVLRDFMNNEKWEDAIKFAAKFSRLGEHKASITRAKDCINNPSFYRQIGKDVDACINEGIKSLRIMYE